MTLTESEKITRTNTLKLETPKHYTKWFFRGWNQDKECKLFAFATRNHLKELYSDCLATKKGGKERFYNIPNDPNEYSVFNFLTTNYSGFSVVVNYLNDKIIEAAKNNKIIATRQLNFMVGGSNWESEMRLLLVLYNDYKMEILTQQDNGVFDDIVNIIGTTTKRGYASEDDMMEFLKEVYPVAKDFKTGGNGVISDIDKGIDIQFTNSGKTETLQQKRCSDVYKGETHYFINGVGGIKLYDTTLYGFQTLNGEQFIFENNSDVEIRNYNGNKKYVIPHNLKKFDKK